MSEPKITYTGELKASALAVTFQHVQEWLEENGVPWAECQVHDESEVVEIVKRYMDTGELRSSVGVPS